MRAHAHTYTNTITINKKQIMNLKKIREVYMGEFEGRKEKREML